MSTCDANTVLSTVVGFSLLIISEVLPLMDVKPNGIVDGIFLFLKKWQTSQSQPRPLEGDALV